MDIKKILAAVAVLCQAPHVWADGAKFVQLYPYDTTHIGKEHKFQVVYDNDMIVVSSEKCSASNEYVHIVIMDENGTIVVDEYIIMSGQGNMINLPVDCDGKTYKIEIEYGDIYLYGYIN